MNLLEHLRTWELVRLPPRRILVKTKWIFDAKRDGEGNVVRFRAELVAKRLTQVVGIDFRKRYEPAARYTTVRLVLLLLVTLKHVRRVLDVKNAFVNDPIKKNIYVSQPDAFV